MLRRAIEPMRHWWARDAQGRQLDPFSGQATARRIFQSLLGALLLVDAVLWAGVLFIPEGPRSGVGRLIVLALVAVLVGWGVTELRRVDVPDRASLLLFGIVEVGFLVAALQFTAQENGLLAMFMFVPVGFMIAYRHGVKALTGHCAAATTAIIVMATAAVVEAPQTSGTVVVTAAGLVLMAVPLPVAASVVLDLYRSGALDAHIDPLTQVLNRRGLLYRWRQEAGDRLQGAVAVICVDLDRFKQINDVHGHGVGDVVLRRTADRMSRIATDGLIARIGGEEFVVVAATPEGLSDGLRLAERLRIAIGDPADEVPVTASIGVTVAHRLPTARGDFAAAAFRIIGSADVAMYAAKRQGGDCTRILSPG